MAKKRPIKKTSSSSTKRSSTKSSTGRVIQSRNELKSPTRVVSSNGQSRATTSTSSISSSKSTPKKRKRNSFTRRAKRRLRFLFHSSIFLGVVFTLLVVSYEFVEGYFEERTKHETLMSEQIIPIYDLQLVLDEELTFQFFVETPNAETENRLISVNFPKEGLRLKKRSSVPYPYLKANCPKDNRYCTLEEASNFTLYLKEEDIQQIQIP